MRPTPFTRPAFDPAALVHGDASAGLLPEFETVELAKGALLSTPDSQVDQVFIVHSGRLRVYLAGDNRELNLSFLEAGDLYTTHTPTYVEAVMPTRLWVSDTRAFARRLAADTGMSPAMMRVLGRLLANAVILVEDLAFRDVPARLARFLTGLVERRGQRLESGWLIPLDFSMQDIANLLGTTRQTVSLLVNQWEREGVLRRQGRRCMVITSLADLARRGASPLDAAPVSASRRTGMGQTL